MNPLFILIKYIVLPDHYKSSVNSDMNRSDNLGHSSQHGGPECEVFAQTAVLPERSISWLSKSTQPLYPTRWSNRQQQKLQELSATNTIPDFPTSLVL